MQRICFYNHPHGVDSHLSILFEHRTISMMKEARKLTVSGWEQVSPNVVWEVVRQEGGSGFRATYEPWVCNWSTPTQELYEFDVADNTFVIFLHRACVHLVERGVKYGYNLRYNAVLCRRYPFHCCEYHDAVNCVTAVLLVIAAGIQCNNELTQLYDWDTAQKTIKSEQILASYTPANAVYALISAGIIKETPKARQSILDIKNIVCIRPTLPAIIFRGDRYSVPNGYKQ